MTSKHSAAMVGQVKEAGRVETLQYERGRRDGEAGLSPTDASEAYLAGYMEGRRALQQEMTRRRR